MARKAKTTGETPKLDPESAKAPAAAKADQGIRAVNAKAPTQPDVAAAKADPLPDTAAAAKPAAKSAASAEAASPVENRQPAPAVAKKAAATTSDGAKPQPDKASTEPPAKLEPAQPPQTAPQRRSAWPLIFAGILTTALGFAAAIYLLRDGGPLGGTRLTAAEADLAAIKARLTEAEAALAQAEAALSKATPKAETEALQARLAAAEAAQEEAATSSADALAALTAKLEDLRQRPAVTDPAATAAYERELAAMREMLNAELAKIAKAAAEATQAQTAAAVASTDAEALAALSAVDTALDTGAGFAEALDQLAALDPAIDLEPMRVFAEGVAPLATLQSDFPAAARTAIEADLAAGASGTGLTGFLKSQLGMRSLAPKDGDDADAVLSRAEAKLRDGDLAGALAELDGLSGPAVEMMLSWREGADRRLAALTAFGKLSDEVRN